MANYLAQYGAFNAAPSRYGPHYGSYSHYPYGNEEPEFDRHPSGVYFRWEDVEEELEGPRGGAAHGFAPFTTAGPRPGPGPGADWHFNFAPFPVHGKTAAPECRSLPLTEVSVAVRVQATIATTSLTQTFHNPAPRSIKEANYSFPLYDGAAVVSFRCRIGQDRVLEGRIKPKAEAKAIFDQAVAEQQAAALLTEHTPEVFEVRLGHVPARMSVQIELSYVHELKADLGGQGALLTIPTSIAPRYGASPDDYAASTAHSAHSGLKITVDVSAPVAIRKLESSSHPISVEMGVGETAVAQSFGDLAASTSVGSDFDPCRARATLSNRSVVLGKDFVLLILAAGNAILQSRATLEPRLSAAGEAALMVSLNPRDILAADMQSDQFGGEIVFIADRSGSMRGKKIETLCDALKLFLKSLPVDCHFNITSFGTTYSSLWSESQAYSQRSLDAAMEHVGTGFEANKGGTKILPPLVEAVRQRNTACASTQIILLTDGEVWNTDECIQYVRSVREAQRDAVRFFALGIGDAVSHRLIEGIGREGGGFGEVVLLDSQGRWDERVIRMLKGALTPASWQCRLTLAPDQEAPLTPASPTRERRLGLRDLMATLPSPGRAKRSSVERPRSIQAPHQNPALHPFARHSVFFFIDGQSGPLPETVTVLATAPGGKERSITLPVTRTVSRTTAIHHLAAKAAMSDLEAGQSWLHSAGGPASQSAAKAASVAKQEAERLGEMYGMTGKWTSFVAVDQKSRSESSTRSYKTKRLDLEVLTKDRGPAGVSAPNSGRSNLLQSGAWQSRVQSSGSATPAAAGTLRGSVPTWSLDSSTSLRSRSSAMVYQQAAVAPRSPRSATPDSAQDTPPTRPTRSSTAPDGLLRSSPRSSAPPGSVVDSERVRMDERPRSSSKRYFADASPAASARGSNAARGAADRDATRNIRSGPTSTRSSRPLTCEMSATMKDMAELDDMPNPMSANPFESSPPRAPAKADERDARASRMGAMSATMKGMVDLDEMPNRTDAIPFESSPRRAPAKADERDARASRMRELELERSVPRASRSADTGAADSETSSRPGVPEFRRLSGQLREPELQGLSGPGGWKTGLAPVSGTAPESASSGREKLSLQELVAAQTFAGSFVLDRRLRAAVRSHFSADGRLEMRFAVGAGDELTRTLTDTVLVIFYIETALASDQGQWELLVQKARRWLRQKASLLKFDVEAVMRNLASHWAAVHPRPVT